MSLAETPRPRRTLSLPGHVRPPVAASPLSASATGAPADGHRVPKTAPPVLAHPGASRGHDPRALSRRYWEGKLAELGIILGEPAPPVFHARVPLPLMPETHNALVVRYLAADPKKLSKWLRSWTKTEQYDRAIIDGNVWAAPVRVKVHPEACEPYSADTLSRAFHARALAELAAIIGAAPPRVFADRIPNALKIGIDVDLIARYPASNRCALFRWIAIWCSRSQYRRQVASGGWRFDLDGCESGDISADAVEFAAEQLAPKAVAP